MSTPIASAGHNAIRPVALVARRELKAKLKTRAFALGTVAILVAIAGYILLQITLIGGAQTSTIGLSGQATHISGQLEHSTEELGLSIETTTVESNEKARSGVESGELDAVVSGTPSDLHVLTESELDEQLRAALSGITQQQILAAELAQAGVDDPASVMAEAGAADIDVTALSTTDPEEGQRLAIGMIMAFLLFFSVATYGGYVAQGVVEEKSSRVVELLLATLRPWHLLLGKVLGLGLVGLTQLVIIAGVGLALATATDVLTISGVAFGTLIWGLVWYLLGYFLYATVYAGAGSLVSRQEDAQTALTPVTMVLVVGFVAGLNVLIADPGGTAAAALSLIPVLSPFLMPGRIAAGEVATWEIGLALVLTLAMIALLTWLSAKIYRNSILHMGSRLSLRQALTPSS